jgi:hypothetical protein
VPHSQGGQGRKSNTLKGKRDRAILSALLYQRSPQVREIPAGLFNRRAKLSLLEGKRDLLLGKLASLHVMTPFY